MSTKSKIGIAVMVIASPYVFYLWMASIGKLLNVLIPWANR